MAEVSCTNGRAGWHVARVRSFQVPKPEFAMEVSAPTEASAPVEVAAPAGQPLKVAAPAGQPPAAEGEPMPAATFREIWNLIFSNSSAEDVQRWASHGLQVGAVRARQTWHTLLGCA